MRIDIKPIVKILKHYFYLMADKEDEQQVVEQVSAGVVFCGTNLWILMFAILIASLGLNVNSTAVIIGAMLVSPLMGPIIGMGLSVGIGDYDLMRRALKNYAVATLISVLTATVYFLISPLSEARSELLARTSPSLYDVLIAFCGGAAGVLALTTKSKGQVIPGVAIATALMPPLCTAGYGLATAQWSYFFGAFYLYFINSVFIALSTFLGVKMLRFHRHADTKPEVVQRGRRLMVAVVVIAMLPATFMTVKIIQREVHDRNVQQFVNKEISQSGTQILHAACVHDTLRVVAVGRVIPDNEIAAATGRLPLYKLGGHTLSIIQGTDAESIDAITEQLAAMASAGQQQAALSSQRIADLEQQLDDYTRYDTLSLRLDAEAKPLFAEVKHIGVGRIDGGAVALVTVAKPLSAADRERLGEWLRARTMEQDLEIIVK